MARKEKKEERGKKKKRMKTVHQGLDNLVWYLSTDLY